MRTPGDDEVNGAEDGRDSGPDDGYWSFMPSRSVAAVAVMALLCAGVVIGTVTSPLASSSSFAPIVLRFSGGGGEAAPPPARKKAAAAPASSSLGLAAGPAVPAATSAAPPAPPPPPAAPEPEPAPPPLQLPPELPEEPELPPVEHVFLIVLGEHGYEETFGPGSAAPYFQKELPEQGELIANYYAVAAGALANQIALLSGQGPTPETVAGCPEPAPIVPGTLGPEKQVEGSGCIYPPQTPTLPRQLGEAKLGWKSYVEELGPEGCADLVHRGPTLYFAELAESPRCGETDVPLTQLEADLASPKKTPAFSYIVPDACHDGREEPCAPEQPAGLAGSQAFLEALLPKITASDAYEEAGLIAITFAAPPPGATEPSDAPGDGGQVGLLLLSPFVEPGTLEETGYYDHYSLLRTIEELLGLEALGHAADPDLIGLEPALFNAVQEGSSSNASCRECASRTPSALHSSPSSSAKPLRATRLSKASR